MGQRIGYDVSSPAWQMLAETIRADQVALDERIGEWIAGYISTGGGVFCGRGCRNCCTLAVNATFPEAVKAASILTAALAAKISSYAGRLLSAMDGIHDLKSYLRLQRQTLGFCPLLSDDGACSIYAARPFSCRSLISTKESAFCALDFSQLSPAEKSAYLDSLDRTVVAFPMHYAALPQEIAQQQETSVIRRMQETFGFAMYGDFAFLVYLELEHRLSEVVTEGYDAVCHLLRDHGLDNPFLVMLDRGAAE
jgi:Fe-S-cluster containining protein